MLKKILFIVLLACLVGCASKDKEDILTVPGYRNINDLREKRICVLLGSTNDDYVTKTFPEATILRASEISDLIIMLKNDKCDVIVMDDLIYYFSANGDPEISIIEKNLYEGHTGIGFGLKNTELRDEFNIMLEEFRNDGTYDQIYERWLSNTTTVNVKMPILDLPQTGTPLRVGVTGSEIPFSYYHEGKIVGFDAELMMRFAQRIGRPIEFKIVQFGGLIAALSSGTIDAIAVGMTITAERSKNLAFANPHYTTKTLACVLTKNLAAKPETKGFTTKEDIKTKRIAVLLGTTHDAYAVKNFPQAKITHCESYTDVVMELVSEKCEVALFNNESYAHMKKSYPQIEMLDSCLFSSDVGIGFSYNQNDLKDKFNAFLKELRASKALDEIVGRWTTGGEDATMPTIKMPTSGKPIRVAVSGTSVPFSFIRSGEHAGLDIELLLRFGQSINRPIEFSVVNFGGLIAALSSGRVDVIASSLMITPERVKQVNFSDPYYYSDCVVAVLGKNLAGAQIETTKLEEKQGFFASIKDSFYNNIVTEKRYMLILKGLSQTLIISILAAALGTILGALICFMRMSKKTILNSIAKSYIIIMRGIPVLVLLMLLYYVVFAKWDTSATIVAIITFALNFAAYVSEMFRTSIEGVDRGQNEAGVAMGFTKIQTFIFIIMPQAIKSVLPVYKGELVSLIKMTSVVGYIAVEDLTKASDIIRSRTFDAFFPLVMVAVLYFILAWGFTAILDRINKKTMKR